MARIKNNPNPHGKANREVNRARNIARQENLAKARIPKRAFNFDWLQVAEAANFKICPGKNVVTLKGEGAQEFRAKVLSSTPLNRKRKQPCAY